MKCQLADTHIYEAHRDQAFEQISREVFESPKLVINSEKKLDELTDLCSLTAKDFSLWGYNSHPAIKAPLLVG